MNLAASTLLLLLGCPSERRPEAVPQTVGDAISLLDRAPDKLEIPPNNRPGGAAPPKWIPLDGPWASSGETSKGMHKFEMRVPIRPRGLFFHRPQAGMSLRNSSGQTVPYKRFVKSETSYWWHNTDTLFLLSPDKRDLPKAGELSLTYPRAAERERRLNRSMSDVSSDWAFVVTEINDGWDNRTGLLLPAPGIATWELTLPPSAELHFAPGIVEPELRETTPSDGATAIVTIEDGEGVHEVWRSALEVGAYPQVRIDLSRWSGAAVKLTLSTRPGATTDYDYVFFGEPAVSSRIHQPHRVVLAFIDTLRPDHLSLYGYERPTSPKLDEVASTGATFTNARSVAPWTLPSARTLLTGSHPEYYDSSETLQAQLRREGWATAMFAGNVYLSANFGMTRDWGIHRVGMWPTAQEVTDDALAWLEANDGRNAIVQVHYMDPHLPYKEPGSYRHLFAGESCCGLREEFHLADVKKAQVRTPEDRQYIRDRYDNNIRYTTDQLDRIVKVLSPNDVLVVFADHGEEFWDHKGFEHGHTLFDELLRVPLVIVGPGIASSTIDEPVSLLDVTPTILDILGVEPTGPMDGRSLAPAMRGDGPALAALATRDLAFGRPLYGVERWGVLHHTEDGHEQKWTTTEGREALYDLTDDPREGNNLLRKDQSRAPAYREHLAGALGREVPVAYRMNVSRYRGGLPTDDLVATLTLPGGIATAWAGDDPLDNADVVLKQLDEETLEVRWRAPKGGAREVYVVPTLPVSEVTHKLTLHIEDDGTEKDAYVPERISPVPGKVRLPLFKVVMPRRSLSLSWGFAPMPNERTQALQGRDDEMNAMLEAIGYTQEEPPPLRERMPARTEPPGAGPDKRKAR